MDTEIQKRKSPRLKGYDYSKPGYYFVTICTHNKNKILSTIVDDKINSYSKLTAMGKIVDEVIHSVPERLNVKIHKYIIMPNHVHLILIIDNEDILYQPKIKDKKSRHILDKTIGYIKMNSSKIIHQNISKDTIWQRSYHDHIIRNEKDYQKIWLYINSNPCRWKTDKFYVD